MAAGTYAEPGSEYGSCKGECDHRDCAAIRAVTKSRCAICNRDIGYNIRLYREDEIIVHAACLEHALDVSLYEVEFMSEEELNDRFGPPSDDYERPDFDRLREVVESF